MIQMVFINVAVSDVEAAREFYAELGFSLHQHFSDASTAAVILSDNIVVMLRDQTTMAKIAGSPAAQGPVRGVVNCLEVDSRARVDEILSKAAGAGGTVIEVPDQAEYTYIRAFSDPDGTEWQIMSMEPRHIIN